VPEKRPYDLKLDWAERHLVKIERLLARYEASRPYRMLPGMQDKLGLPRLHFTSQPPDTIPFILGDFLYNVRAALDYLAGALAPSENRGRVNFPILWQGVWDPPIEGDVKQRLQDRQEWNDWLAKMRSIDPRALAIIQQAQPPKPARDGDTQAFAMLNRLRNKDTHQRLHIVATALIGEISLTFSLNGERILRTMRPALAAEGVSDAAPLHGLPVGAMDVEITGTPAVFVRLGKDDPGGYLMAGMREVILKSARLITDRLREFDRMRRL
jgi:hypothetical protein